MPAANTRKSGVRPSRRTESSGRCDHPRRRVPSARRAPAPGRDRRAASPDRRAGRRGRPCRGRGLRGRNGAGGSARSHDQILPEPVHLRLLLQAPGDGRGALDAEPPLPLDRAGERRVHARRRRGRRHGGRHRRHRDPGRAGRAPHPPRTGGAARRDRRLRPGPPQAGAGDPRERWSITVRFTFLTVIPSELVVYNPMGILITYLQADRALVTEPPR